MRQITTFATAAVCTISALALVGPSNAIGDPLCWPDPTGQRPPASCWSRPPQGQCKCREFPGYAFFITRPMEKSDNIDVLMVSKGKSQSILLKGINPERLGDYVKLFENNAEFLDKVAPFGKSK